VNEPGDNREDVTHPASAATVRDYLANERTLLAWVRTGIALIGLGFAVARFGLTRFGAGTAMVPEAAGAASSILGTMLISTGATLAILATLHYVRTGRAIESGRYRWSPVPGVAVALMLVTVALVLTIYLLLGE
jgi:inner membrane protein YidH